MKDKRGTPGRQLQAGFARMWCCQANLHG